MCVCVCVCVSNCYKQHLGFPHPLDSVSVHNSYYGRPNKTVHYSHVTCRGAEDNLTQCAKATLSLTIGKRTYKTAAVAGVSCRGPPTKPPCITPPPLPTTLRCTNGQIRLMGGESPAEGRLEYCYKGQWSPFCTLRAQEATVACKELGYNRYTGEWLKCIVDRYSITCHYRGSCTDRWGVWVN